MSVEQMADAADLAVRQEAEHRCQAKNDEANDRDHFEQGEPELEFTVVLHAEQVGSG
ncbi:hypothetical protein D3C77_819650 [compost metagenome]